MRWLPLFIVASTFTPAALAQDDMREIWEQFRNADNVDFGNEEWRYVTEVTTGARAYIRVSDISRPYQSQPAYWVMWNHERDRTVSQRLTMSYVQFNCTFGTVSELEAIAYGVDGSAAQLPTMGFQYVAPGSANQLLLSLVCERD